MADLMSSSSDDDDYHRQHSTQTSSRRLVSPPLSMQQPPNPPLVSNQKVNWEKEERRHLVDAWPSSVSSPALYILDDPTKYRSGESKSPVVSEITEKGTASTDKRSPPIQLPKSFYPSKATRKRPISMAKALGKSLQQYKKSSTTPQQVNVKKTDLSGSSTSCMSSSGSDTEHEELQRKHSTVSLSHVTERSAGSFKERSVEKSLWCHMNEKRHLVEKAISSDDSLSDDLMSIDLPSGVSAGAEDENSKNAEVKSTSRRSSFVPISKHDEISKTRMAHYHPMNSSGNSTIQRVELKNELDHDTDINHGFRGQSSQQRFQPHWGKKTLESGTKQDLDESTPLNVDSGDMIGIDVWPKLPNKQDAKERIPFILFQPNEDIPLSTDVFHSTTKTAAALTRVIQVSAQMNQHLFTYQRIGIKWMFQAFMEKRGCILGDDMGLGKTIQVIALLSAVFGKDGTVQDRYRWRSLRTKRREAKRIGESFVFDDDTNPAPVLIVCPASLLENWEAELNKWMCCATLVLNGKRDARQEGLSAASSGELEIVICSYEILRNDILDIMKVPWVVIVFDEMHCLKNPESGTAKTVAGLKCARKIGLTGTLMQNNHEELHCLVNVIVPGILGSKNQFKEYYSDVIKYARKKSASLDARNRSAAKESELQEFLKPYYLRREKTENSYFEKIKKEDKVVFCHLTDFQLRAYRRILDSPDYQLLRHGSEPCDCGRNQKKKNCCYVVPEKSLIWERFHRNGEACKRCPNCIALVCVAQLLKLSNHIDLLKVAPGDEREKHGQIRRFAEMALAEDLEAVGGSSQSQNIHEMRRTDTCGKLAVLDRLLAVWKRKREKVLLFSRSTRMLDILEMFLFPKGYKSLRLDGGVSPEKRLSLVDEFNANSSIPVFLISTKAGGVGLNITSATNVVIFDPSWNPAHDFQAQDRAYRIGQSHDVKIYRLVSQGTIEELIYIRQIYKQQLADVTLKGKKGPRYFEGIQGDPKEKGELFGIENLLRLEENGILCEIKKSYHEKSDHGDLVMTENQFDYSLEEKTDSKRKRKRPVAQVENIDVDLDAAERAREVLQLIDDGEDDMKSEKVSQTRARKKGKVLQAEPIPPEDHFHEDDSKLAMQVEKPFQDDFSKAPLRKSKSIQGPQARKRGKRRVAPSPQQPLKKTKKEPLSPPPNVSMESKDCTLPARPRSAPLPLKEVKESSSRHRYIPRYLLSTAAPVNESKNSTENQDARSIPPTPPPPLLLPRQDTVEKNANEFEKEKVDGLIKDCQLHLGKDDNVNRTKALDEATKSGDDVEPKPKCLLDQWKSTDAIDDDRLAVEKHFCCLAKQSGTSVEDLLDSLHHEMSTRRDEDAGQNGEWWEKHFEFVVEDHSLAKARFTETKPKE